MFRLLLALFLLTPLIVRGDYREFRAVPVDAALGAKLTQVAAITLKEFPRLTSGNLALGVIDLTKPESVVRADYYGDTSFYPASLVKLFFMVETYHQGHITPEIERALREMIQVSDNDAAGFLLDVLTGWNKANHSGSDPRRRRQDLVSSYRKASSCRNRAIKSLTHQFATPRRAMLLP